MSQTLMRVVIYRWYCRGEGWAYHPDLKPNLTRIIKAVESHLTLRSDERFRCRFDGDLLVGDIFSDANCPNRDAAGRNPSILRVAYSKRHLLDCELKQVYDLLDELSLPDAEGPNEQLEIQLCNTRIMVLDERDVISISARNHPSQSSETVRSRYFDWGILAASMCVLAATLYSLQNDWNLARQVIDLALAGCLAWTFYLLRCANSAEEGLLHGGSTNGAGCRSQDLQECAIFLDDPQ